MIKRHDFIERTVYLMRKEMEENLPDEDTLEEMIRKTQILITKIFK